MKGRMLGLALLAGSAAGAGAGELKQEYFAATPAGAWAEYSMESADGTRSTTTSRRLPDQDGRIVIEEGLKVLAGAGAGTESKNTHILPADFNLARDGLVYALFTEKMTMKYGEVVMPVDAATLEAIKKGSKDFRGAVTFEGVETVDRHACDRYAYEVVLSGPAAGRETGRLWLDATLPFALVRQVARSANTDGTDAYSYEVRLRETGRVQVEAVDHVEAAVPPAAPAEVSLIEGYKAGRIGLEVTVEAGSSGRRLRIVLINKLDARVTVDLAPGELDLPAGDPVGALKIRVEKAAKVVVPPGDAAPPLLVGQRPGRGVIEGTFEMSVYEGTPLFSGSVTRGTVSK